MDGNKSEIGAGLDDQKTNTHMKNTLDKYKDSADVGSEPIEDIAHDKPASGQNPTGFMKGPLMNWRTQMLEAMDDISTAITTQNTSADIEDEPISGDTSGNTDIDQDLLKELNDIFTPILVMQGFENGISRQVQESYEQADVLTEKNIIQFDDTTRMAQLLSTCAILLQKKKNTEKYQMYAKAAAIRNQMKLDMQKEEYDAAKALAQKYLVMVSTTNNSSVARDAATNLLPETQH